MKCKNCGAEIEKTDPRCPYCSAINEVGAEKEYLDQLEDLKDQMEDLEEKPGHILRRYLLKIVIGIMVFILAIVVIAFVYNKQKEKNENQENINRVEWENENYPKLDQWYDAGEYDAILNFQMEQIDKKQEDYLGFILWEHSKFIQLYGSYDSCMTMIRNAAEDIKNAEIPYKDRVRSLSFALSDYISFLNRTGQVKLDELEKRGAGYSNGGISSEEGALLETYVQEVKDYLFRSIELDQQEIDDLYKECTKEGFVNTESCKAYSQQYFKQ